jgi:hypothetical protein
VTKLHCDMSHQCDDELLASIINSSRTKTTAKYSDQLVNSNAPCYAFQQRLTNASAARIAPCFRPQNMRQKVHVGSDQQRDQAA